MYGLADDDFITSIAMSMFFSFKKSKEEKTRITVVSAKKVTKEGRRVLDQIREQAEDVKYEEICN